MRAFRNDGGTTEKTARPLDGSRDAWNPRNERDSRTATRGGSEPLFNFFYLTLGSFLLACLNKN
ncbi:MAG: hypothetical protein D6714_12190 [Bacteroidetes bacterium]|nr:MAG: hypothetical protein D6714_12190 [Bacteroidota bacterium]